MLTRLIEGGAWTATVAQDAFNGLGEIGAAENGKDVLRDIRSECWNEQGYAVDDGIFALTTHSRALEDTFENIGGFFANDAGDLEWGFDIGLPAHRANGGGGFEVLAFQRLPPDHDCRATWRHDFANRGGNGGDT